MVMDVGEGKEKRKGKKLTECSPLDHSGRDCVRI